MQCEIARQFFDMLTAITSEQKIPREYTPGQVLYHAEIDLLEKIEANPASNVSTLSVKSGVTKSAVTQMSRKLLEKGLIETYQDPKNKKEKYFRLTRSGKAVREKHAEYNRQAADKMRAYLCSMNAEHKKIIVEFLSMMKTYMPMCAFACRCTQTGVPCFLAEEKKGMDVECWN